MGGRKGRSHLLQPINTHRTPTSTLGRPSNPRRSEEHQLGNLSLSLLFKSNTKTWSKFLNAHTGAIGYYGMEMGWNSCSTWEGSRSSRTTGLFVPCLQRRQRWTTDAERHVLVRTPEFLLMSWYLKGTVSTEEETSLMFLRGHTTSQTCL